MGLILAGAGRRFNAIEAAALADASRVSPSSTDSELVKANLYRGDPSEAFKFGSGAANASIAVDLDIVPNGGFETWTLASVPDGWTVESGTATENTSNEVEGTSCLQLSDLNAKVSITILVPAGARFGGVRAQARGNTSSTAAIYIQNLATGKYLQDGASGWTATQTPFSTSSSTSYDAATADNVDVESIAVCGLRSLVPIKISCEQTAGSQNVFFDAIHIWFAWNFAAVLNHDVAAGATLKMQRDTDSAFGSPTDVLTFDDARPNVWGWGGSDTTFVSDRYARLIQTTENFEGPASIGELVIGRVLELETGQELPRVSQYAMPSVETVRPSGGLRQANYSDWIPRRFPMKFYHETSAFGEFWREVIVRSRFGADPVIIVPDKNETTKSGVMFGRLKGQFTVNEPEISQHEYSVEFVEDGFGLSF